MDTETQDGVAILIVVDGEEPVFPLGPRDILDFIVRHKIMIAWNADYDIQAMLKWFPRNRLNRLAETGEMWYDDYYFRYVPSKFLRVWHEHPETGNRRKVSTIYDLKQFYALSLDKAAEKLGLQRKKKIPKSWYSCMQERLEDPRTRKRVLEYAQGDVQTLAAILKHTQDSFEAAGLPFQNPVSNAIFAQRYFKDELVGKQRYHQDVMKLAYKGGRMECLLTGFFEQAYYLDIHSAYPSVIAELYRDDGRWDTESRYVRSDAKYAAVLCQVSIPENLHVGPIPMKTRQGLTYFPVGTFRTTITLSEYNWLLKYGMVKEVYKVWQQYHGSHDKPFSKVADIFAERKKNPQASYAFKTLINSLYGKLAQQGKKSFRIYPRGQRLTREAYFRDGGFWMDRKRNKWHTSFSYAAEITARIRLRLLDELPLSKVIFYATDGVMLTEPFHPDNSGPGLGQWGFEEVENLIVVGSGVYQYDQWIDDDTKRIRVTKFRGFSSSFGEFSPALYKAGRRHQCVFHVNRNTSLKQSTRDEDFNIIFEADRYLDVNFDQKRIWEKRWCARELTQRQFTSLPWIYQPTWRLNDSMLKL